MLNGQPEKVEIRGYVDSRLRDLMVKDAQERRIPLSECVAQACAKAYDRPDLAAVPRKTIGRPLGTKIKKKGKAKEQSHVQ